MEYHATGCPIKSGMTMYFLWNTTPLDPRVKPEDDKIRGGKNDREGQSGDYTHGLK